MMPQRAEPLRIACSALTRSATAGSSDLRKSKRVIWFALYGRSSHSFAAHTIAPHGTHRQSATAMAGHRRQIMVLPGTARKRTSKRGERAQ